MAPDTLKITCDVGGTFTDVVISDVQGRIVIGKSLSTPPRFIEGLLAAIGDASATLGLTISDALAACSLFVYSTTQATNAILEGKTARTALLVTEGFPDTLIRREGGSMHPYDFDRAYPEPYIPRSLTFEVAERVTADGLVLNALQPEAIELLMQAVKDSAVEAVAVCLLWSTLNPAHELALGDRLAEVLPGVPVTLSHQLNPITREYRRASGTAIDASLKVLMQGHLAEITAGLAAQRFDGELLAATSVGGVLPMEELVARPILAAKSGPSLAPVAGLGFVDDLRTSDVIVCDTGGTSFDISLIRDRTIVATRETWLGGTFTGHLTGLSSVDVRSIGAGGGSIAWLDPGGLLRVGPESAGADPGPACYGNGGQRPTVTDAALHLGYLDPERFLGGRMRLDPAAAERALSGLAHDMGVKTDRLAEAIVTVSNGHMVDAIKEITINQGIDPRGSGLVAGGGAAGLGIAAIARELGCRRVMLPRAAGALSAFGGQHSDIVVEEGRSVFCDTANFDFAAVQAAFDAAASALGPLADRLRERGIPEQSLDRTVEARYPHQAWTLTIGLPFERFVDTTQTDALDDIFHATHERIFAVSEPGQRVEVLHCSVRLAASPPKPPRLAQAADGSTPEPRAQRAARFPGAGVVPTDLYDGPALTAGMRLTGPAVVTEPTTTLVVPPGWGLTVTPVGDYLLEMT